MDTCVKVWTPRLGEALPRVTTQCGTRWAGKAPVQSPRVDMIALSSSPSLSRLITGGLDNKEQRVWTLEFNAESCLPGIKPNLVYFPEYEDQKMKSYSMEDGKFDATSSHIYDAQWFQPDF
ncbi:hypothetical protein NL676_008727 [Syzygium grande]|nr:hypothetical protein NL676_008727 [Syzygium grande]